MAPPGTRLRLLGAPVLELPGRTLVLAAERRYQLLALLAHRSEWVSREQIAALFWPEHPAAAARGNLRKLIFRLAAMHGLPPIEHNGGHLRWAPATDLAEFEAALAREDWAGAGALWGGLPWQGLDDGSLPALAEWLGFERQRLHSRWRQALLRAAGEGAVDAAQRLLAGDPLDEEALRALLRALARTGRGDEIEAAYRRFAQSLESALGSVPSIETRALLAPAAAAVLDAPAAPPTHPPDDGLIGRRTEQRELLAWLQRPEGRWITISGAGGSGKTRFLRATLPQLAALFADGATWVGLEDLRGAEQIGERLAAALGLTLAGSDPALAQVQRALQPGSRVLALDNLEHLLDAVPALQQLLHACPGLRIVATSRERCGAALEWTLPLAGLPCPEPGDADRAEVFDAVRLFERRAREVQPRFELAAERDAVVALCAWVEGLPLALELGAAWTRHCSVAEILRDLRAGGEMLRDGTVPGAPAPPRHRGMAAAFDYSWRLLQPAERETLAALALLQAGFSAAAARAVASASLAQLTALVDKSLLRRDDTPAGSEPRFSLHPLLQQLAALRLDAAARSVGQARHAAYFLHRLAQMLPQRQSADRVAPCRALAPELPDLAAAWSWAVAAGRTDLLRLAAAPLRVLHYVQGLWTQGLALLLQAEPALQRDPPGLSRLHTSMAVLLYFLGRCEASVERCRAALHGMRRDDDGFHHRLTLLYMGQSLTVLGRTAAAQQCFEQALRSARADGDPLGAGDSLGNLAGLDYMAGRYDAACQRLLEVAQLRRERGGELAMVLNNLGLAQIFAGQPQQAITTLSGALPLAANESNPWAAAYLHYNLALAFLQLRDAERADQHAATTETVVRAGLAPVLGISVAFLRGRIAVMRNDAATARQCFITATAQARQRQLQPMLAAAAIHWALWRLQRGESARAATLLAAATQVPDLEHAERLLAQDIGAAVQAAHDDAAHQRAWADGLAQPLQTALDAHADGA